MDLNKFVGRGGGGGTTLWVFNKYGKIESKPHYKTIP